MQDFDEAFWNLYRVVEKGTTMTLDQFESDKATNSEIRRAVGGLIDLVFKEAEKMLPGERDRERALWELMKRNVISAHLAQELLDILSLAKHVNEVEDAVLYGMLVRIMEDLEELYFSLKKNINQKG